MGEPHLVVHEPVSVLFRHLSSNNVTRPRCVHWDAGRAGWSGARCSVASSNATHTRCSCSTLGTLAVLETVVSAAEAAGLERVTLMVSLVVTGTVVLITVLSLLLLGFYCKRVKVRVIFFVLGIFLSS